MRSFYIAIASILVIVTILSFFNVDAKPGVAPKERPPQETFDIPTNQLIVKYKDGAVQPGKANSASEARLHAMSNAAGMQLGYVRAMSETAHVLSLPERLPASKIEEIAARIANLPDVEYAEPDYILMPTLIPNDTYYGSQWHYFETYGINLPAAWDVTTGSSSIKIAVIDTGITNHADLSGRWVGGYDFISDSLIANDGNGRDSDPHDPGDWITSTENAVGGDFEGCGVDDSSWHGTHVAGTIGAKSNNGSGVTGVNWNSLIVPIRVLGKCGGYTSDIIDGMRWAAGLTVSGVTANLNPAQVLNLSLGGVGSCSTSLQDAINEIRAAGSVIVVAAGNSNANLNLTERNPANCSGVITVAASNRLGSRAYYSNYGSTIEISAPGGDGNGYILSTLNTGTTVPASDSYVYYQGTSMATPHVAGVVSLMLSVDPTLTPDEVLQILQSTAKPFPAGSNCTTSTCGSGIVNAGAAVNAVVAQLGPPDLIITNVTINPSTLTVGSPFDVVITVKNQGGATGLVNIYRDVYIGVDPMTILDPVTGCPPPGDYYRFDALNLGYGQTDTKAVTVTGGLPMGNYKIWTYVDSRCLIAEASGANAGP